MVENRRDERYLYVVEYTEDAERKRAEYLFSNWDDGEVTTPDGLVRLAAGVNHEQLYERLLSKIPEDQIETYRIEPADADVEPQLVTVEESIDASADAVESFLEYVLSKKKAVLQSASRNEYELYTKKGRAEASYQLQTTEDGVDIRIRISGYPPAPSFLAEFFETELAEYAASQSPSDHP